MKKITKRENFETLRACVLDHMEWFDVGESEQLVAFIDKELENLDKRAANAKKYASKKKAENDELYDCANTVLNEAEAAMTIPEIVAAVNERWEMDATPQKMTYRLNKLVEDGLAIKEQVSIKVEGKPARKVNAYSAAVMDGEEE